MHQHVEQQPVPPSEVRPEVPGDLEALILWMLAKDRARRPTAAEVAAGARPEPDTVVLTPLPVRRTPSAPVLAAAAATIALVVSIAAGLLLGTRGLDLPTTADLSPDSRPTKATGVVTTERSATGQMPLVDHLLGDIAQLRAGLL